MSERWRRRHYGDPCSPQRLERVDVGGVLVPVDGRTAAAFRALGDVLDQHDYRADPTQTGSYNCRKIAGTSVWSSHAWAIAVDVNWRRNPRRRPLTTDLPPALIRDAEALRTNDGARVFTWGGRWNYPDPMHFEVAATPAQIATGIAGHDHDQPEEANMLKRGDSGNGVTVVQRGLLEWNAGALPEYGADGDYGAETEAWVKRYQRAADLEPTGVTDGVTSSLLLRPRGDAGGWGHDETVRVASTLIGNHARDRDAHHGHRAVE